MIYLAIYLIGIIPAYIIIRKKEPFNEREWFDIFACMFLSLIWPFTYIAFAIMFLVEKISISTKPPKWL